MLDDQVSVDPRVVELLDRWITLGEQGASPAPGDLTSDPHLLGPLREMTRPSAAVDGAPGGGADESNPPAIGIEGRIESS